MDKVGKNEHTKSSEKSSSSFRTKSNDRKNAPDRAKNTGKARFEGKSGGLKNKLKEQGNVKFANGRKSEKGSMKAEGRTSRSVQKFDPVAKINEVIQK